VYLDGDDIVNMEKEKTRGSRLKCSRCRLPGAVLGCYHDPCANTYHAPCARMIPECHSDAVRFLVDIVIDLLINIAMF
jgi:BRCA1-associated RING domain protein 1